MPGHTTEATVDRRWLGCGRMIIGSRRYFRQRGDHRAELLGGMLRGKPIRDIPLVGTLSPVLTDIENTNPLGDAAQGCDHLLSMFAPLGVIVRKHHHIGVAQVLGKLVAPFLDTARVRRRREPDGAEVVYILLAFRDVDRLTRGNGLHQLGQQVGDAARVTEGPNPAAIPIGTPLPETFRLIPDDLKQQLAVLVGVVVGRDDLPFGVIGGDDGLTSHQPFATKPFRRLVIPLASDQVIDAAALIGLVVEPSSIRDIDRQRTAAAISPLVSAFLGRLAEQSQRDRLHKRIKVNSPCEH